MHEIRHLDAVDQEGVGRIYETRGGPDSLRWFWSMTVNGPMTRSDRVATPEEAKAQFQKSWDAWKAWAKPTRYGSGMGPPAAKDGGAPRKRTRQQPGGQRAPGSRVREERGVMDKCLAA